MSNWIPTNERRIIERKIETRRARHKGDTNIPYTTKRIIQQKWVRDVRYYHEDNIEWRDVTVVEEE